MGTDVLACSLIICHCRVHISSNSDLPFYCKYQFILINLTIFIDDFVGTIKYQGGCKKVSKLVPAYRAKFDFWSKHMRRKIDLIQKSTNQQGQK
jgi:hypothetical protein